MGGEMTSRTIDESGRDEFKPRKPSEQPVDYLLVMRLSLDADQVYDIEENEEAFCEQIRQKIKAPVKWVSLEVVK
jgi:hypothetical protein